MAKKLFTFIGLTLSGNIISCTSQKQADNNKASTKAGENYTVAAYVWPSCHHDERFGDMLWPDGTGEWEVIKKGNPRFEGHYQPKYGFGHLEAVRKVMDGNLDYQ
jgi:hypothetical protein